MKNKASADGRDLFLCVCCLATGYRRGLLLIFGLRGSRLLSLPIKVPFCDSSLLSCLLSVQPGTVRGTTTRTGEAETVVCGNKGRSTPQCLVGHIVQGGHGNRRKCLLCGLAENTVYVRWFLSVLSSLTTSVTFMRVLS